MLFEGIQATGSFQVTGSVNIPYGPSSSRTRGTGSLWYNTDANNLQIDDGEYWVTLTSSNESLPNVVASSNIEYLVVAGGGGGGAGYSTSTIGGGGGGGAGGLLSSSLSSIESGSSITVTVGAGGTGQQVGSGNSTAGGDSSIASSTGTNFTTVTVTGGGRGGSYDNTPAGGDGGSGGGGAYLQGSGGSGTSGQGFDGGDETNSPPGYGNGGGGGASEAGADGTGTAGGDGGDGKQSSITGTSTYYAGGGGGGIGDGDDGDGGAGGQGGGGTGGEENTSGTAGSANTGGGGGGGGNDGVGSSPVTSHGGAGGSGVVILAYPSSSISANGGSKSSRSDGHIVHIFNSSGTLTIGGPDDYPAVPEDNFNVVLYTGTGATRTVSVGFQPDLVWIKRRNSTNAHVLQDSITGVNQYLIPSRNNAEATHASFDSFDANGFTLTGGGGSWNNSSQTYVAWSWKAGGISGSNTDGTVTSQVSANTTAGFSIVEYTGLGSNMTVGHGLDSTPELVIFKATNAVANWLVLTTVIDGSADYLILNENNAKTDLANTWSPDSTLLNFPASSGLINNSNGTQEMIAYCFYSVPGYQDINTYTGTGVTGNQVDVGFQPRFVLIKNTTTAGAGWVIVDEERGQNELYANVDNAEDSSTTNVTFISDGFQLDTTGTWYNKLNDVYLYLAIA